MTWESGSTDQQRLRAGYAVLCIGLVILMFAWGMAVARGPQGHGDVAVRHEKIDPPGPGSILPAISIGMFVYGICLIAMFVLSVVAFVRLSRRYRDHLLRPSVKPTPTSDVWQMHKLPDVSGDDEEDADE